MLLQDRLDRLERAVADLVAANATMPIIVEGKRDVVALRKLGVTGEVLMTNTGQPLIDFADALAQRCKDAVLLTDWDRTGGTIGRRLREVLRGRVRLDRAARKTFAVYSEVRCVEELPAYLDSVRRRLKGDVRVRAPGATKATGRDTPAASDASSEE